MENSLHKSINAVDNPIEYLNGSVWVKLAPSSIHGVGVFAIRDIPKGTRLTDNSRNDRFPPYVYEIRQTDFPRIEKCIRDLIMDKTLWGSEYMLSFISPNSECFLQDFCNHSNTPNTDTDFISLKDIKIGEEIVIDFTSYKIQGGYVHPLIKEHMKNICKFQ